MYKNLIFLLVLTIIVGSVIVINYFGNASVSQYMEKSKNNSNIKSDTFKKNGYFNTSVKQPKKHGNNLDEDVYSLYVRP